METPLAESHTVDKWLSKTKRCKRHTHSKTNYNKNKPCQKKRLETVSEKYFTGVLKSILRGQHVRQMNIQITVRIRAAW